MVNHLRQTLKKYVTLLPDLLVKAVMRNEVNILKSVLLRHSNVGAIGDKVHGIGDTKF